VIISIIYGKSQKAALNRHKAAHPSLELESAAVQIALDWIYIPTENVATVTYRKTLLFKADEILLSLRPQKE